MNTTYIYRSKQLLEKSTTKVILIWTQQNCFMPRSAVFLRTLGKRLSCRGLLFLRLIAKLLYLVFGKTSPLSFSSHSFSQSAVFLTLFDSSETGCLRNLSPAKVFPIFPQLLFWPFPSELKLDFLEIESPRMIHCYAESCMLMWFCRQHHCCFHSSGVEPFTFPSVGHRHRLWPLLKR